MKGRAGWLRGDDGKEDGGRDWLNPGKGLGEISKVGVPVALITVEMLKVVMRAAEWCCGSGSEKQEERRSKLAARNHERQLSGKERRGWREMEFEALRRKHQKTGSKVKVMDRDGDGDGDGDSEQASEREKEKKRRMSSETKRSEKQQGHLTVLTGTRRKTSTRVQEQPPRCARGAK